ncbi:BCNT-domain-containing protein [Sodiomyces alkalinus F11]|uniref:SWR1-complex protein 5 n=1 Tax=Sodiomyces alkalinus (strain CBS 110278 / VKM F-3762 / F11) TaxID=1314773 RepID=A0A3N2PMW2_SODAK|nr:BCNT-domain-containing protein [Sodiomyces alkalinus F11]ROT35676.1 BCNT-domain-containing protein [Sodiomyces alkalinus F11]
MPPDAQIVDDEEAEEYESSQDSDFNPEANDATNRPSDQASSDSDSDSSDDQASSSRNKRKRPSKVGPTEDAGFENSGDEAIISKAKRKKRKKNKSSTQDDNGLQVGEDDDEGGEGGLIKTRSMRAQGKEERKAAAITGPVTIDVDSLWAQMIAGATPAIQPPATSSTGAAAPTSQDGETMDVGAAAPQAAALPRPTPLENDGDPPSMIRIKRTYNFAGKVHTEVKLVPRDSAEAKLYLASQKDAAAETAEDDDTAAPPQRTLKKAFRSAFEPVLEQTAAASSARSDLNLGVSERMKAREDAVRAKKLNTVEKSRMDWAGYVDREGLKDELELAGRSKGSYAERQDFLSRSEARREEGAWKARVAGKI